MDVYINKLLKELEQPKTEDYKPKCNTIVKKRKKE